jgi:hypothetical protein
MKPDSPTTLYNIFDKMFGNGLDKEMAQHLSIFKDPPYLQDVPLEPVPDTSARMARGNGHYTTDTMLTGTSRMSPSLGFRSFLNARVATS